jgi:hypothetical protein
MSESDRHSGPAACDEPVLHAAGGSLSRREVRRPRRLLGRPLPTGDDGMTTAEYAVGTVAACGFAGVLWAVVHSSTVAHLLSGVVARALQTTF